MFSHWQSFSQIGLTKSFCKIIKRTHYFITHMNQRKKGQNRVIYMCYISSNNANVNDDDYKYQQLQKQQFNTSSG
jgi:hypothetical protein